MKKIERIGILTGGGDAPGLNAVIRAAAKKAILKHGWKVLGIVESTNGLLNPESNKWLDFETVSGILQKGGTILGTTNRGNPFLYPVEQNGKVIMQDVSDKVVESIKNYKLDGLIVIGGDGTMAIADRLHDMGVPLVGVPKTIDNDLLVTDLTFGFETAVNTVMEMLDRLQWLAMSKQRVVIVEVMGRNYGWIALHAGVAGGADIILIPEIPYNIKAVARKIEHRRKHGADFSIIVIAEGAHQKGQKEHYLNSGNAAGGKKRLGGAGEFLAEALRKYTDMEIRLTVLGHLQRGGSPVAFDRILSTRFGSAAVNLIEERKFGYVVGLKGSDIISTPVKEVAKGQKPVPLNYDLLQAAKDIGISFGE